MRGQYLKLGYDHVLSNSWDPYLWIILPFDYFGRMEAVGSCVMLIPTYKSIAHHSKKTVISILTENLKSLFAHHNLASIAYVSSRVSEFCFVWYYTICLSIYGSTTLVDLGRFFSFLIHTQSEDSLDGGSARRKAATYTQNKTNTEKTHTDIHASSGIGTHDPSFRASEDSSCLTPRGHCDGRDTRLDQIKLTNFSSTWRLWATDVRSPSL
jgi:hypothetical protein